MPGRPRSRPESACNVVFCTDLHCLTVVVAASSPNNLSVMSLILRRKLPSTNRNLLRSLLALLGRIASNYRVSQMTPRALAYVFGPTLLRLQAQSMVSLLERPKILNSIVLLLIQQSDVLLGPPVSLLVSSFCRCAHSAASSQPLEGSEKRSASSVSKEASSTSGGRLSQGHRRLSQAAQRSKTGSSRSGDVSSSVEPPILVLRVV